MMSKTRKTTPELSFDNLLIEWKVLNKIDAGTAKEMFAKIFLSLVNACAELLYDGKKEELIKILRNNLVADKKTRLTNDKYQTGYLPDKPLRLALVELIDVLIPSTGKSTGTKSKWQYNEDDLAKVDDVSELANIINNYASAKSKVTMLAEASKYFGLTEEETKAKLDSLRKYARERIALLSSKKATISESLAAKLAKGGKTSLTAAEAEELRKLLG